LSDTQSKVLLSSLPKSFGLLLRSMLSLTKLAQYWSLGRLKGILKLSNCSWS